ncbi:uncharacterized protein BDR25DRAFT_238429 [Lindgomyces ingoldianus]|uniref:Uncharacterized protein n=1 Tax=Lindgomyces ingoldianus TaxID=673940 RepID=A0ACB6QGE4_9PLEO|nr:uncharacterized protein BDR25DRAFT_238429 [Lindgomyces ingoldianus]KAF2465960.1 hypothetical protein BDR25DRAFT_238429 [Lindgomyces ingoldianus]
MFGHPGISAMEFAGTQDQQQRLAKRKAVGWKTLIGKRTSPTHDDNTAEPQPASANMYEAETGELHTVLQHELSCQQRRRGMFMNHTPRKFEIEAKKQESQRGSEEVLSRAGTSCLGSEKGDSFTPLLQDWELAGFGCQEQDPVRKRTNEILSREQTEYPESSFANSLAGKLTRPSPLDFSTPNNSQKVELGASNEDRQGPEKRRRRQSPYRDCAPVSPIASRSSPLEPFIAQYSREETGSSTEIPVTTEKIDAVAVVSQSRACQKSSNGQEITSSSPSSRYLSSYLPNKSLLGSSPELPQSSSLIEPTSIFPIEKSGTTRQPPEVPSRNPRRLTTPPPRLRIRSGSRTSNLSSDFAVARGIYSPYDNSPVVCSNFCRRRVLRPGQASPAGSSILGRMAPPILGHQALAATTDLNDLNSYLKYTGPSPKPLKPTIKKKVGFSMFKVGGKKSLEARVGSVEGAPDTSRDRPRATMSACAREMTTSSGARHLRIVIPSGDFEYDRTITLPVSGTGVDMSVDGVDGKRRSRHVSITWTDEMLNRLGSPELEHALEDFNAVEVDASNVPCLPIRSPKRSLAVSKPVPVPVDDHPLVMATREEQTKAKKLRDRKRIKMKDVMVSTTLLTPVPSPVIDHGEHMDVVEEEGEKEKYVIRKMVKLQDRVEALQKQNIELVRALAEIVGVDIEGREGDVEGMLRRYRELKRDWVRSGNDRQSGRGMEPKEVGD